MGEGACEGATLCADRTMVTRAPVFNRGSGGGARGCGFEKRVYMRIQGGFNLHRLFCPCVCVSQNGGLFREVFIYINDFDPFNLTKLRGGGVP